MTETTTTPPPVRREVGTYHAIKECTPGTVLLNKVASDDVLDQQNAWQKLHDGTWMCSAYVNAYDSFLLLSLYPGGFYVLWEGTPCGTDTE